METLTVPTGTEIGRLYTKDEHGRLVVVKSKAEIEELLSEHGEQALYVRGVDKSGLVSFKDLSQVNTSTLNRKARDAIKDMIDLFECIGFNHDIVTDLRQGI